MLSTIAQYSGFSKINDRPKANRILLFALINFLIDTQDAVNTYYDPRPFLRMKSNCVGLCYAVGHHPLPSPTVGSLSIDGASQVEGTSPGTSQALNLATPTYVGGVPDYRSLAPSAAVTRGFGGCIDNLVINGARLTLNGITSSQDVQNCGEDPCDLLNCLNGGVCVPGGNLGEFVCQCVANYTGPRCELEIPDPCILVECLNGGRCVVDEGVARSGCPVPYSGDQCQDSECC